MRRPATGRVAADRRSATGGDPPRRRDDPSGPRASIVGPSYAGAPLRRLLAAVAPTARATAMTATIGGIDGGTGATIGGSADVIATTTDGTDGATGATASTTGLEAGIGITTATARVTVVRFAAPPSDTAARVSEFRSTSFRAATTRCASADTTTGTTTAPTTAGTEEGIASCERQSGPSSACFPGTTT